MAQLALITEKSLSRNDNRQVGDIVGVYKDEHIFSEHERSIFEIVKVPDSKIKGKDVEVREVVAKNGVWKFEEPFDEEPDEDEKEPPETKEVWKDDKGNYRLVKVRPRFAKRYEKGEVKENYSRYKENLGEVIKLN